MGSNPLRKRLTGNVALVVAVAAILLAFGGRGEPGGEARQLFEPALSLVRDGTPKIANLGQPASAPRVWGDASLASSVVHLPGALLVQVGAKVRPQARVSLTVFGARLASAVLAGILAVQFFGLALSLGLSLVVARIGTGLLLFATSAAVLGRTPLPHMLHAVVFTGAFSAAMAFARAPDCRSARNVGLWLAGLLALGGAFALVLPGVVVFVLWYGLRAGLTAPALGLSLGWPLLLGLGVTCIDSYLRLNSPTSVFAALWAFPMKQGVFSGLWSLFVSPGKSILLYNLPIVLGFFGVRAILERGQSRLLWLGLVFVAPAFLYLAKHPFWTGGWGWGPRHAFFAVPVLLLPALYFLEMIADLIRERRLRALILPGLMAVYFSGSGLVVQTLGSALAPENYLGIAAFARSLWLGGPNRSGAFLKGSPASCSPCFEDDYTNVYLPPFQPIEGHAWLASHLWAGDDVATAQLDGPWHRETILDLDIKVPYEMARFDWWILDHLNKVRSMVLALVLFAGLLFLAAFALLRWFRDTNLDDGVTP